MSFDKMKIYIHVFHTCILKFKLIDKQIMTDDLTFTFLSVYVKYNTEWMEETLSIPSQPKADSMDNYWYEGESYSHLGYSESLFTT